MNFLEVPQGREIVEQDIFNFGWMACIWDPIPKVRVPRQSVALVRGGSNSKKVTDDNDDDFMPRKRVQNRGKRLLLHLRGVAVAVRK